MVQGGVPIYTSGLEIRVFMKCCITIDLRFSNKPIEGEISKPCDS